MPGLLPGLVPGPSTAAGCVASLHVGGARQEVPSPRGALRIGRFFGVPIYLSISWLVIAAGVTLTFADVFRRSVDGASGLIPYLLAFAFALLSVLSVLAHELGHAAMARRLGLGVRQVLIFLLGGVTEITPEPDRPRQEFLVAVAGPLVSAGLAGLAWAGWLATTPHTAIAVELELLIWSNLLVAVFNALPGLPLDGGRAVRAALWALFGSRLRATVVAAWGGRLIAVAVAVSGVLLPRAERNVTAAVISVALGAFLWFAASTSLASARLTDRVPRLAARELVRPALWVPASMAVAEAVRLAGERGAAAIVVLDPSDAPRGVVAEAALRALPEHRRPWTTVAEIARPIEANQVIDIGLAGRELLHRLQSAPADAYLVHDEAGRPVGVLTAHDFRAALTAGADVAAVGR